MLVNNLHSAHAFALRDIAAVVAPVLNVPGIRRVQLPDAAQTKQVADGLTRCTRLRGHNIPVVAHWTVPIWLVDLAQLELKHYFLVPVGSYHY